MYPPIGELNWETNTWWSRLDVRELVVRTYPASSTGHGADWFIARLDGLTREILHDIARLRTLDLPFVQTDGDYYRGNVHAIGDKITGVFDWDETHYDSRAWEVGRAIWAFGKVATDRGVQRSLDRSAIDFLRTYESVAGRLSDAESEALIPLAGADVLFGILYSLGSVQQAANIAHNDPMSWDYVNRQVRALEGLRGVEL